MQTILNRILSVFILSTGLISGGFSVQAKSVTAMQYNVENLFDTMDDPAKADDEFTPDGSKHWTEAKLKLKFEQLGKIITSVTNSDGSLCPDVLTLTEVENAYVLKRLRDEALSVCKYTTMVLDMHDPDPRGIKTALLSRLPLASQPISHPTYKGGRFIQETHLHIGDQELIVFVNHWKSRLTRPPDTDGGEAKRAICAKVMHTRIQEIFSQNPDADILAMGDFNDEFENVSIGKGVPASANAEEVVNSTDRPILWESSFDLLNNPIFSQIDDGPQKDQTLKFARATFYYPPHKEYDQFDHILMSRGLFDSNGFTYHPRSFRVVRTKDNIDPRTKGPLGFRTSEDDTKAIGASDHFPVLVQLDLAQ